MTFHLAPFDTIAEASLLHYPLGAPLLGLRRIDRRFDWVQFDRDMEEGEK